MSLARRFWTGLGTCSASRNCECSAYGSKKEETTPGLNPIHSPAAVPIKSIKWAL